MAVAARPSKTWLAVPRGGGRAQRLTAARASRRASSALSFAVRVALAWLRATPVYFGDEYLYSSLGRSLAETGRPLVRGRAANFPALLEPLLTAPAWLFGDVGIAYHLAQTIGALAMSLAAVPVYWLARRLGLGARASRSESLRSRVALPDLIYATWMVAEPFAYPLVLAARRGRRRGARAALAPRAARLRRLLRRWPTFARVQFVVLPACFLGALVLAGLRERRLRSALREQAAAAGPVRGARDRDPRGRALARPRLLQGRRPRRGRPGRAPRAHGHGTCSSLLFSSGFVLVPGAILGLALALARPRTRGELVFGAMALLLAGSLLVEAGLFGAFDQAQERYLFYFLPLVAF